MKNAKNKVGQITILKSGKGIQYLLNAGYEILGNPLYMHDIDYKLLSYTQNIVTDDPLWNELITTGIHGEENIEFFKNEFFIDAVANTKTITYLASDKLKYDRILGKIFYRDHIMVACADVVACNKPFEEDDPVVFGALCKKLSKEISKNESFRIYGEMHQETVICKLIEGHISDKKLLTGRVAEIYEGLKGFIYIAVADASKNGHGHTLSSYYKDIFKRTLPAFKYAIYGSYIVIIFSSDRKVLDVKKDLKKFKNFTKKNDICIGISQSFENLFELRKYYTEAINALNYGLKNSSSRQVYLYNEIPADIP